MSRFWILLRDPPEDALDRISGLQVSSEEAVALDKLGVPVVRVIGSHSVGIMLLENVIQEASYALSTFYVGDIKTIKAAIFE